MESGEEKGSPAKKRVGRTRLFVWLTGVLVVLLVLASVFYFLQRDEATGEADEAIKNAEAATATGDYEKALDTLKQAEDQAMSKAEKVTLYSNLAAAASNAGKIDEALGYYALKHQVDPSTKNADGYVLGVLYERQGSTQKAIDAYKLYLEHLRTQPESETSAANITNTEELIRQLEEGA